MEKYSEKIIEYFYQHKIISKHDREIYLFGFIFMLRVFINILTSIIIGILCNMLVETVIFVVFTVLLRTYSGGFHSDDTRVCYLISVVTIILALLSVKFNILGFFAGLLMLLFSLIIILKYAPVGHRNKILDKMEIKVYKNILSIIIVVLLLLSVIFIILKFYKLVLIGEIAFFVDAIMILIAKKKYVNMNYSSQ